MHFHFPCAGFLRFDLQTLQTDSTISFQPLKVAGIRPFAANTIESTHETSRIKERHSTTIAAATSPAAVCVTMEARPRRVEGVELLPLAEFL
jgi:hypothetical protein